MRDLKTQIINRIKSTENTFPSLAIYIEREGEIIVDDAIGYASIEEVVKATNQTQYNLGSMLKLMTASCIAILKDRGALDFQDNLSQYLPDHFPNKNRYAHITLHELLTHTSGLSIGFVNVDSATQYTFQDYLINVLKDVEPESNPEKKEMYSNYAYAFLGLVIETITSMKFEDFLYENILKEVGIENKYPVSINPVSKDGNIAIPYVTQKGYHLELKPKKIACFPAGEGYFKLSDYAKFIRLHMNGGRVNGKQIIKQETIDLMHQVSKERQGKGIFGYGCIHLPKEEIDVKKEQYGEGIFHTGGVSGFSALYHTNKAGNYFILLATNSLWYFDEMYNIRDYCLELLNE